MNTSNKIETLDLILSEMANANETFTGSKELNISEEYPTKFIFAYNPEYGIQKEISFGEVVNQNEGTKQYLSFPYTVLSDLNFNEHKWGLYVNETFSRMLKAFEGLKNASDTNNTRSISNNNKIINNFQLITKDLNELNSLISLSDSYRNKLKINRYFKCKKINMKQYSSNQVERVKLINWKLDNFVKDKIVDNESILKDNIIQNNHITKNTITYDRLKLPYVRMKEDETWATAENFSSVLVAVKANKNKDLLFLTRNDQITAIVPKYRFVSIGDEQTGVDYKNIDNNISEKNYISLEKDIIIDSDYSSNLLVVNGNYFSLTFNNQSKLLVNELILKNLKLNSETTIQSDDSIILKDITISNSLNINSNNISINSCSISELILNIDIQSESNIHIGLSKIKDLVIIFNTVETNILGNIYIDNNVDSITFKIDNIDYTVNDIKTYKKIKKYFKNINIG